MSFDIYKRTVTQCQSTLMYLIYILRNKFQLVHVHFNIFGNTMHFIDNQFTRTNTCNGYLVHVNDQTLMQYYIITRLYDIYHYHMIAIIHLIYNI